MIALRNGFLTALIFCANAVAEEVLEVISLNYRTAQEVIPLVQPIVNQSGGTVTGAQNQLIIRTSPDKLAEIRKILAAIDKAPRQLLITVEQGANSERRKSEAEIAANVGNDNARVILPGSGDERGVTVEGQRRDDSIRARVHNQQSIARDNSTQQVRVLEGNPAFIYVGQTIPLRERALIKTPAGTQITESTHYRDVANGFHVLPRVAGDRVTLEISPQREMLGRRSLETQNVNTSVT
ncbi:MAG: secretin N-terminal domain-containing protein, partial [Burkholderiales bacterium]